MIVSKNKSEHRRCDERDKRWDEMKGRRVGDRFRTNTHSAGVNENEKKKTLVGECH